MQKFSGLDYLRIDVSNQLGNDKKLWAERLLWFKQHEHELENLENDADDYFRYASAVKAYRAAKAGKAIGHLVGLDACSSGPQILSVIVGCVIGARNTGAVGQLRSDLYTVTTDVMATILEDMGNYARGNIKSALMPMFYGSQGKPKEIFGEESEELNAFYEAAESVCPGAYMLLPIMLNLWDPTALQYVWDLPDMFEVIYLVLDTLDTKIEVDTMDPHITFKYRREVNTTLEKAAKIPANVTQSIDGYIVRELTARCDYNQSQLEGVKRLLTRQIKLSNGSTGDMPKPEECWRKHQCMSLVGVDYINEMTITAYSLEYCEALLTLIGRTLNKPSFQVVSIHDEFMSLAPYVNHVRQTYIDILCELADSRILDAILSDVAGHPMHIKKLSENLSDLIKDSEYPLS